MKRTQIPKSFGVFWPDKVEGGLTHYLEHSNIYATHALKAFSCKFHKSRTLQHLIVDPKDAFRDDNASKEKLFKLK